MSILVKLAGQGVGLAREAQYARKERKAQTSRSQSLSPSTSTSPADRSNAELDTDSTEQIAELPTAQAEKLIAKGQAIPIDAHAADDRDEYEWQLDDAIEEIDPESHDERPQKSKQDELLRAVAQLPPPNRERLLPLPVILPQRRPRAKARGFVRGYAPVLQDVGIDQATFLKFVNTFDDASKASPMLDVIFISASIVGLVPEPICQITSTVVTIAVGAAKETQSRHRANTFLDTINEQMFKPRGLYCFVMAFKPDKDGSFVSSGQVNLNDTIAKYIQSSGTRAKDTMRSLRAKSGTTNGELELPEAAPLIFPAIDHVVDENGKKQNSLKSAGKFVGDYMDRRAQAKFHGENPDTSLPVPKPEFKSRYSDPNGAASSGDLVGFVSGGKFTMNSLPIVGDRGRRTGRSGLLGRGSGRGGLIGAGLSLLQEKRGLGSGGRESNQHNAAEGYSDPQDPYYRDSYRQSSYSQNPFRQDAYRQEPYPQSSSRQDPHQQESYYDSDSRGQRVGMAGRRSERSGLKDGPIGMVKRIMQKDVLYLMIANMPTDAEIAESRARMAQGKF